MPTKVKEPLVRPPLAPWHRASWPSLEKGAPRKHPVSLERAKNPWLRAAARPGSHGKEQRAPQGPEPPASTATHSPPTRYAQPVLQVCLAPRHQGPAPNSLTGRKDVNRGQGAAGGQRQQVFCLHLTGFRVCSHHATGGPVHSAKNPSLFTLQVSSTSCHLLAGLPSAHLRAPSQPCPCLTVIANT